jgi:hypothetical protein
MALVHAVRVGEVVLESVVVTYAVCPVIIEGFKPLVVEVITSSVLGNAGSRVSAIPSVNWPVGKATIL